MYNFFATDFALNSKFQPSFHRHYLQYLNDWRLVENCYANWLHHSASSCNTTCSSIIPSHIHQIWLGSKYPSKYHDWRDSWLKHNPNFSMTVWDEESILALPLNNRKAFLDSKNYGIKSDIARYEILYLFGGIYVDTDFECLKPLSSSFLDLTFFAGNIFSSMPQVANGLMGSIPGSPFMKRLIDGIPITINTNDPETILATTGPIFLTQQWLIHQRESYDERSVIFPSNYFYPITNFQIPNRTSSDDYTDNSFADHHWEVSWMKSSLVKRLMLKFKKYF
jgi:mannosyltransferase OCH1-like enzyme